MNDSDQTFQNKIALITGSGRGIGRAIALELAQRGADIVVNFFRNRGPAEATAQAIRALGRRAELVKANIGEIDEIELLFQQVEAVFGGLDILVCNAASGYNRPALEQKPKGWEWTMNINARALLFCAQLAAPLMEKRGGGVIVSISSPGAVRVLPEYVVVGASKAALEALTRYLAVELAPKGIVVNALSPGIVDTEALRHFVALQQDQWLEKVRKEIPAGRMVTPEDVAEMVAFLASPAASMIRGQTIIMDGGHTLPLGGPTFHH
jgi:enoyl-[acyl-carrier protein] reductase III